jgi:hypothetical protein
MAFPLANLQAHDAVDRNVVIRDHEVVVQARPR